MSMVILGRSHDEERRGATTPDGLSEWIISDDVNKAVVDELRDRSVSNPLVLRFGRRLVDRVATLKHLGKVSSYDCAIECHCNRILTGLPLLPDSKFHGYSVLAWYRSDTSIHLADCILDEIARVRPDAKNLGINRVASSTRWVDNRREYEGAPRLAWLEDTPGPAVIVEACYLSNPEEAAWIAKLENRKSIGWAIARGVDRWLTETKRESYS